jgi:hypothetical protein
VVDKSISAKFEEKQASCKSARIEADAIPIQSLHNAISGRVCCLQLPRVEEWPAYRAKPREIVLPFIYEAYSAMASPSLTAFLLVRREFYNEAIIRILRLGGPTLNITTNCDLWICKECLL